MGERVGHDIALRLSLETIIADGGGRLHGGFDVARLEETPPFLGVVRPYPGETIRLELHPHLELIGFNSIQTALRFLHLAQETQQILHVVADFVRDHIGL
jgi:hypothetical protein